MASRQTAGTTSANQYAAPAGYANASIDINLSNNPTVQIAATSALATALVGSTINSLVVGPIEVWSDCAVWDTTNSRYLRPVFDFDPSLLHRSGMGC
jgi:hypothetical protein